jgi:hypothetical protein
MPTAVILVYLAYVWVGLLHAIFVGTCVFAWRKNKIKKSNLIYHAILIFCILFFFETYWIKIFHYFQINITTNNSTLHNYFSISKNSNIANSLSPSFITVFSCFVQTCIALFIGKKLHKKLNMS